MNIKQFLAVIIPTGLEFVTESQNYRKLTILLLFSLLCTYHHCYIRIKVKLKKVKAVLVYVRSVVNSRPSKKMTDINNIHPILLLQTERIFNVEYANCRASWSKRYRIRLIFRRIPVLISTGKLPIMSVFVIFLCSSRRMSV
jgi:hypothetical protein